MDTATLPLDVGLHGVALRGLTVREYHAMAEAGILHEDDRVELLDGHLVAMSPLNAPHVIVVNRLTRWLTQRAGAHGLVSVQNPLRLNDFSEPEPDLVLVHPDAEARLPAATDALLVVEVADSTLRYDRGVKRQRYAQAGIPELWVVALAERYVEVSLGPQPDGGFTETRRLVSGDALTLAAFPDVPPIPLADLFAGL